MAHGTMEEKIYKRQVTKEGLSARVVDRQQVRRTISKEEMLHLFEFGDDENHDGAEQVNGANQSMSGSAEILPKHEPHLSNENSADKLMESLLSKHYPRYVPCSYQHLSIYIAQLRFR